MGGAKLGHLLIMYTPDDQHVSWKIVEFPSLSFWKGPFLGDWTLFRGTNSLVFRGVFCKKNKKKNLDFNVESHAPN